MPDEEDDNNVHESGKKRSGRSAAVHAGRLISMNQRRAGAHTKPPPINSFGDRLRTQRKSNDHAGEKVTFLVGLVSRQIS